MNKVPPPEWFGFSKGNNKLYGERRKELNVLAVGKQMILIILKGEGDQAI